MPTSKECRQHAESCLQLAQGASELYVKMALTELASDFEKTAEHAEHQESGAAGRYSRDAEV